MTALGKWLWGAPERCIHTDTVVPLFPKDDSFVNRKLAVEYTMHFEETLDAEKIANALWKLLEKPGWRKLGGRLRLDKNGRLEYHIPAEYSKERPPINFTKVEHKVLLADHPLGKVLPRSNGTLQTFGSQKPLRDYLELNDNTRYLDDWLKADRAQLGLHIVTFSDATFVTLTWIHTLLDGMGRHALLGAWVAMLEGRENDVPEFCGYDQNPLDALGAPVSEQPIQAEAEAPIEEDFVLSSQIMTGFTRLRFLFNYVWELVFHPSETVHTLCMPSSYLARLRAEALNDLATAPPELLTYNTATRKPFISDGDILLAWTARLLTAGNPQLRTSSRPMVLLNVLGLRDSLSRPSSGYQPLIPKHKAYIHNCTSHISTFYPTARQFLQHPLGHIAARIRKDLGVQGTRAQVEALERLARQSSQLMTGPGNMAVHSFSNWSKARLFEVDFSSAIVGRGEGAEEEEKKKKKKEDAKMGGKRGRPVYIQPDWILGGGLILRGLGYCIGVDANGDVWLAVRLRSDFAVELEREVERLRLAAEVEG